MAKIVDLSKTIRFDRRDPWWMRAKVGKQGHMLGGIQIRLFFKLPYSLFPKGFTGWANDTLKMGVHSSTHLDAPWHYGPASEGKAARTIDEVPLEWCYGPGVVIDATRKPDFEMITAEDIERDLDRSGASVGEGTIVLIKTGRDALAYTPDFTTRGTGMSREATEWLVDRGVKVIGIDQWGFDLPLPWMAREARRRNDREYFWQAHLVGVKKEYCHIEQLTNLGALPPAGFKVAAFPLKIEGASAGPARVVAIFEEETT